jgi:hypothetical protein
MIPIDMRARLTLEKIVRDGTMTIDQRDADTYGIQSLLDANLVLERGRAKGPFGAIMTEYIPTYAGRSMVIEEAKQLISLDEIRRMLDSITQGEWAVTGYSGEFSFNGPLRVYCGIDKRYGEPLAIPANDVDTRFIALAPRIIRQLLAQIAEMESPTVKRG